MPSIRTRTIETFIRKGDKEFLRKSTKIKIGQSDVLNIAIGNDTALTLAYVLQDHVLNDAEKSRKLREFLRGLIEI